MPEVGETSPTCAAAMTPASAASRPARPNAASLTFFSGTPVAIAACWSPPMAKIWFPTRCRWSSAQQATDKTTNQIIAADRMPKLPLVRPRKMPVGLKVCAVAPCTSRTAASQIPMVPSVVMNDGILK